jgi:multidrug efflux system outer membrane protein
MKKTGLLCGIISVFVLALTVWAQSGAGGDAPRLHFGKMWDTGTTIATVGASTAAFFPTIKFNGLAGFQSADIGMQFDWPSRFWAVGPSLTLLLFQGGQLTANLCQAKAAYEETVAKYRGTVLTAFADVENNLAAEYLIAGEYGQVMDALKAARKQLEIANNRYHAGLVTFLEVATAQNVAPASERTSVRLHGQQLVAAVALIKSIGGSWYESNKGDN